MRRAKSSEIPYSGETEEELRALVDQARKGPDDEELAPPTAETDPEREGVRLPFRRLAAGLGLIAALALVFWFVESHTGWNGLDESTRAEAVARYSQEAARIAGKPVTIRCDEAGEYVGAVQHADGVAAVGGDLAYLTPERCLDLYRLAFEGSEVPTRAPEPSRFSPTSRGIFAASPTKGSPSAMRCSPASNSDGVLASRRTRREG